MTVHHAELVVIPPAPVPATAPPRQVVPVASYSDDVIERCFCFWSTIAGRNAEATQRHYQADVEDDEPIPSARTIRHWAVQFRWAARADAEYQDQHSQRLYDLQLTVFNTVEAAAQNLLLVASGAFDDNPHAGLLRLKSSELALRSVERGVFPVQPKPPLATSDDWASKSLEEREAIMREAIQAQKE
jgi:hypothetical protein